MNGNQVAPASDTAGHLRRDYQGGPPLPSWMASSVRGPQPGPLATRNSRRSFVGFDQAALKAGMPKREEQERRQKGLGNKKPTGVGNLTGIKAKLKQWLVTGEFVFVIGPPGCGKSTFFHCCFKDTHTLLDVDVEKRSHPRHNELKQTEEGNAELHAWVRSTHAVVQITYSSLVCFKPNRQGKEKLKETFTAALATKGISYYSSTAGGTTTISKIRRAKAAGFFVRLLELRATGGVDASENNQARVRVLADKEMARYNANMEKILADAKKEADSYQLVVNDSCNWLLQGIDMDTASSGIAQQATQGVNSDGFKYSRQIRACLDVKALPPRAPCTHPVSGIGSSTNELAPGRPPRPPGAG